MVQREWVFVADLSDIARLKSCKPSLSQTVTDLEILNIPPIIRWRCSPNRRKVNLSANLGLGCQLPPGAH